MGTPGDNRQLQRFPIAVSARVASNAGNAPLPGTHLSSRDVCSGGAFFLTPAPLDVGTRVVVQMELGFRRLVRSQQRSAQVTVSGEVLRVEKEGMAVRFDRSYKMSSIRPSCPNHPGRI